MQDYFMNVRHARPHWGKTVLWMWMMSPLMTPYYSQILKLPQARPSIQPSSPQFFTPKLTLEELKKQKETVKQVVSKLPDDGAYGTKIKQRILQW